MKVPFEKIEVGKKYKLVLDGKQGWNRELTGTIVIITEKNPSHVFYKSVKPVSFHYRNWAQEQMPSSKNEFKHGFEFHSMENPTFKECMEKLDV